MMILNNEHCSRMTETQDTEEQKRKIREQQKCHSELLAAARASVEKLQKRGETLVELLPPEKQIAPLSFFLSISPAGHSCTQGSDAFRENPALAQLAQALSDCAKEVHSTMARGRLAMHASGSVLPQYRADQTSRKRKESHTNRLQKSVQKFFKDQLQPKGHAAFQACLAAQIGRAPSTDAMVTVEHVAVGLRL